MKPFNESEWDISSKEQDDYDVFVYEDHKVYPISRSISASLDITNDWLRNSMELSL